MNIIKKGDVYTASKRRFGKSDKGDWEMLTVTDEKGHNAIAVFVSNRPSKVEEGGSFRIEEISAVSVKTRKDDKGAWWTDVSVNAQVTEVKSFSQFSDARNKTDKYGSEYETLDDSDGQLPF